METLRQALGTLLALDLAAGFVLLAAAWLAQRRRRNDQPPGAGRGLVAAFGCLTACLVLIYAGLWMLAGG